MYKQVFISFSGYLIFRKIFLIISFASNRNLFILSKSRVSVFIFSSIITILSFFANSNGLFLCFSAKLKISIIFLSCSWLILYLKAILLNVSKLSLVCPNCSKSTSVMYKIVNDKKNRFCKKCNELIG